MLETKQKINNLVKNDLKINNSLLKSVYSAKEYNVSN